MSEKERDAAIEAMTSKWQHHKQLYGWGGLEQGKIYSTAFDAGERHGYAAGREAERREIAEEIINIGHNDDCLFCCFKDKRCTEIINGQEHA
jgi:hypothetical protein